MKTVSVINYKGGVGKTTLTANLGTYAALMDKKVLLIDLDPQTNLTFSFMNPEEWKKKYADERTLKNFFDPIINEANVIPPLSQFIINLNVGLEKEKRIDLISSHLKLINIDVELSGLLWGLTEGQRAGKSMKLYSYLRNELDKMQDDYDLVIIDCPPNFSVLVKNALLASDFYIVPTKLDYLSTLGVKALERNIHNYLKQCERDRQLLEEKGIKYPPAVLKILGIVPMMVNTLRGDELIAAEENYLDELSDYYIFRFVRNNSTLFGREPVEGVPAVLARPKFNLTARKIVNELKQLGDEFIDMLNLDKRPAKSSTENYTLNKK